MSTNRTPLTRSSTAKSKGKKDCSFSFSAAKLEALFQVLDAIAWMDLADNPAISQFGGLDPRTTGKLLRNAETIGLIECVNAERYLLRLPYPHRGSPDQKRAVVREALVRMPLLENLRQFVSLGEKLDDAARKAATVVGVHNYQSAAIAPLIQWATELDALGPRLVVEDLIDAAVDKKEERHQEHDSKRIVFLSHAAPDKAIIRQLATDLVAEKVGVWIDEQRIHVGDSIPERVSQGVAESDFFLIALSEASVNSEWVKRELNAALVAEIGRRKTTILPIKLSECEIPAIIADKKYADFTKSYKDGLRDLLTAIRTNPEV